jgi:N utilization substance protein A
MNEKLIEALKELELEKEIPRDKLISVLEAALVSAYKKDFGSLPQIKARVVQETGDMKIVTFKTVVKEAHNPKKEITKKELKKLGLKGKLGEEIEIDITPQEFGRIAAQTAKQIILQKIKEEERELIYKEFKDKEGEVLTGTVERQEYTKNFLIGLGKTDALLPRREQVFQENYSHGDRIKVYVLEARRVSRGPQVIVSRTHPRLLVQLLELEVPEISSGDIEIKSAAREPGTGCKIAVASRRENVDPVGACVGVRGTRVNAIVQELRGERVDIVRWNEDSSAFITNALSPAKVTKITLNREKKLAEVIIPDDKLSLAIGKGGRNVRLAARLTGWKIDLHSESEIAAQRLRLPELSGVGPVISERLEKGGFQKLEDLLKAKVADLTEISGIGKKTAEKIISSAKEALKSESAQI